MARIWMTRRHDFHPASAEFRFSPVGKSVAPFDSLNLRLKVGDQSDLVLENRTSVAQACEMDELVFMDQIHSATIREATLGSDEACDGIFLERASLPQRRIGLAVQVADCVPLVITHTDAIAAIHIGREGLLKGMTESGIEAMAGIVDPRETIAIIGPSICGSCYQVSEELLTQCADKYPESIFSMKERKVDVAAGVISILKSHGIRWQWFSHQRECVSCNPQYFSYRRDGVTGRQAMIVGW